MNTIEPIQYPRGVLMPHALALKPVSKDDVCLNICKKNLAKELKQQINELGNIMGFQTIQPRID